MCFREQETKIKLRTGKGVSVWPRIAIPGVRAAQPRSVRTGEAKSVTNLCLWRKRRPDGLRARLPRIEELIQFARKNGYKRLGIAHCGGLA